MDTGHVTAWSCEIWGGRKGGEMGEGPCKGWPDPGFPYRHSPAPWAVTPWPSPLLTSPLPRAVTKKHLAGSLLSGTHSQPQLTSRYQTSYSRVCISKKLEHSLRGAKHQVRTLALTSTRLSNSKPIPKDLVACDDSIVITNTYYHALLVSEA